VVIDPNSPNSVPGRLTAWLDARAPRDAALDDLLAGWEAEVRAAALEHGVDVELAVESRSPAVRFDVDLADRIDRCLRRGRSADTPIPLDTAAGHDAGALAASIPTAMLFIRNPTGVSHSPLERAGMEDCVAGSLALADVLDELAKP
jgi:N-carbamoyl-L-amino-acid hydrolase